MARLVTTETPIDRSERMALAASVPAVDTVA